MGIIADSIQGTADLTLNGPVTAITGGILSYGGTIKFGTGANGTSFGANNTGMRVVDTALVLETNIVGSSILFAGSATLKTNGKKLLSLIHI